MTLESPLDCKEIQPVHPKGDQSWVFIGRTDAEAETPILWPPDAKSWLIVKDPDAGKDWRRKEKGTRGWDGWMASLARWTWIWVNLGVGGGQGGLVCCSSWGRKESDMTERLKWTELSWRGTKEPLDESERGERKSWLKTLHSKTKIMESSPITSWQIEGEKLEAGTFHFLGLQNHCGRWLQPWN